MNVDAWFEFSFGKFARWHATDTDGPRLHHTVQLCTLRSGSRGWGPAVPTGIRSSRLRSGSAHWDLELTVEVRECPLRPGSCGWGPAVPTAICNSRLRSGSAHWDLDCEEEAAGEEAEEENSSDKI